MRCAVCRPRRIGIEHGIGSRREECLFVARPSLGMRKEIGRPRRATPAGLRPMSGAPPEMTRRRPAKGLPGGRARLGGNSIVCIRAQAARAEACSRGHGAVRCRSSVAHARFGNSSLSCLTARLAQIDEATLGTWRFSEQVSKLRRRMRANCEVWLPNL